MWHGVRASLSRAELIETDDSGPQQLVRAYGHDGETFGGRHKALRAGFHGDAYHAPPGSEGVVLSLHGEREQHVLLGFEHPDKRVRNLPVGAKAIYDANGNVMRLLGDSVPFDFGNRPWTVTCGTLTVTAQTKITLQVGDTSVTIQAGRVDLGGPGGARVQTVSGPSSIVYAKL